MSAQLKAIQEPHACFVARLKVRDAAMGLARAGLSDDVIREALADIAATEAERAIAWGAAEDRRQARADADDTVDQDDEMSARAAKEDA